MRQTTLLLMGLAFTVGLVIGLIIHLPGVSSPEGNLEHRQRSARHLRSLAYVGEDDEAGSPVRDAYSRIKSHNASQGSTYLPESGSAGAQGLPLKHEDLLKDSINDIQAQIKQTKDSIQALRHDSSKNKYVPLADTTEPVHSESDVTDHTDNGMLLVSNTATVRIFKRPQQPSQTQVNHMDRNGAGQTGSTLPDEYSNLSNVLEDIYWSPKMELLVPVGYGDEDIVSWHRKLSTHKVVRLSEGCGRMQNRLVTLEDGSRACARYRLNTDQIQGEVFSYYLARILNIANLPPTALAVPERQGNIWAGVRPEIIAAQWNMRKALVLTPWQNDLQPAYIPRELRRPEGKLFPAQDLLHNRNIQDLVQLVQWSDLVVLDYLTANVDRVVNNMFNLQWNSAMMDSPAHNLQRHSSSNLLVFLDNESGLFHSYRLLDKYADYHTRLLDAVCIFRKSTADAIKRVHRNQSAAQELQDLFKKEEHLHMYLPTMPEKNINILQERVRDIYEQIMNCESKYGTST